MDWTAHSGRVIAAVLTDYDNEPFRLNNQVKP